MKELSGMTEKFSALGTGLYLSAENHQIIHLTCGHFMVYKLCLKLKQVLPRLLNNQEKH